jgi:hypothetical protein
VPDCEVGRKAGGSLARADPADPRLAENRAKLLLGSAEPIAGTRDASGGSNVGVVLDVNASIESVLIAEAFEMRSDRLLVSAEVTRVLAIDRDGLLVIALASPIP